MRFITLLLSLLILGYLIMAYLAPSSTETGQTTTHPRETIERAEQQINKAMDDYQQKMNNYNNQ